MIRGEIRKMVLPPRRTEDEINHNPQRVHLDQSSACSAGVTNPSHDSVLSTGDGEAPRLKAGRHRRRSTELTGQIKRGDVLPTTCARG